MNWMNWQKAEAKKGSRLTRDTARRGMICTDLDGDRVVIHSVVNNKYAEVGVWCNGHFSFENDLVRYDEMTFTGEIYTVPKA